MNTVHGWERWNLEVIGAGSWSNTGLSLELFSANPHRMARTIFAKSGCEDVEHLLVQRILTIFEEDSRCEEDWTHRYFDKEYLDACQSGGNKDQFEVKKWI